MWSHISHSLLLTLLHSFWQSALLLLLYMGMCKQLQASVRARKHALLILLISQLIISCSMFAWFMNAGTIIPTWPGSITGYFDILPQSISILYLVAVIWQAVRTLYQWHVQQQGFKKSFITPTNEVLSFVQENAESLGIRQPVSVWFSERVMTPLTYGFFRPVILFPIALYNQLTIEESEALLMHELSHIREHDYLMNWVIVIAESLFFFNPFIRRIIREYRLEREFTCDDIVVSGKSHPLLYAEALFKTARFSHQNLRLEMAAVSGQGMLLKRIARMTNSDLPYKSSKFGKTIGNFLAVGLLFLSVAGFWILAHQRNENKVQLNASALSPITETKTIASDNNASVTPKYNTGAMVMVIEDEPAASTESLIKHSIKPSAKDLKEMVAIVPVQNIDLPETTALNNEVQTIPVALQETREEPAKEIIIQDEDPESGLKITRAYRPYLENGEWKAELLWVMTEEKPLPEPLRIFLQNFSRYTFN